jgi:hypothetical protein
VGGAFQRYSYLDLDAYKQLDQALAGASLDQYRDMKPDLLEGGKKNNLQFDGGARPLSVVSNGNNDIVLASAAPGLINKGIGTGVAAFTAAAAGGTDAGTTFVVSPGDETIVGGGPKDKLVLPTDRLWSKSSGMPTPTDVSSTITLKGGYGGPVEGDGDVAAAYSFNSFTATSADTVIGTGLPGDDHVPRTEVNLGTIQDYQYAVNYDLMKNDDLIITLGAFSNPLTPGKNNSLGSVDPLWNSTITIKNYHPGDFGLTFTTDTGKNLPPSQAVAVQLSEDKQFVSAPQDQKFVDDDPSQDWNGRLSGGGLFPDLPTPISDGQLARDLNDVMSGDQPASLGPPVSVGDFLANQGSLDSSGDGIPVSDTAANVAANLDALNGDANVSAISLTDTGTPTLNLSATQAAFDTTALGKISNAGYSISISDAAANVAATLDQLNANTQIGTITLTDSGTPELGLTASQALDDTTALGKISNANIVVDVADSLANVAQQQSALAADANVSSVGVVDSAATILGGTSALQGLSSGLSKLSSVTVADTASNILSNLPALAADSPVTAIDVVDSSANVSAALDALNGGSAISSIALTDFEAPVLTLTAAEALGDTVALAKVANPDYSISIVDTAANVLANATALAADTRVGSIDVADSASNIFANRAALGGVAKFGGIEVADTASNIIAHSAALTSDSEIAAINVTDTAANIAANIDSLDSLPQLGSVTFTDAGTPALLLSASQASADGSVLRAITNADYNVEVSDTAANVATNIDGLSSVSHLSSINLTDTGTPALGLTVSQWADDTDVIGKIANASYSISISDAAAAIAPQLDALNGDSRIGSITLTDDGTPTLGLSAAQTLDDQSAISKITNVNYQITVSDTAANAVASASALDDDAKVAGVDITDTAANVLGSEGDLASLSKLSSETVSDSAANILGNLGALAGDGEVSSIKVVDSAANVAANIDALQSASQVSSIFLTDAATPSLTLTVAQAIADQSTLNKIANPYFFLTISDTAANVAANLDALSQVRGLASIALTDTGPATFTLTADEAGANAAVLNDIAGTNHQIAVTDSAASVSSNFDALSSLSQLTSITLTDAGTPSLDLTAAQAIGDSSTLSKITNPGYAITVTDSAANVSANFDALSKLSGIASIDLTDGDGASLTLTATQSLDDSALLNKITTPDFSVSVVDTAQNILQNSTALKNDAQIGSINVADTATNIVDNLDALGALSLTSLNATDTAANIIANYDALNASGFVNISVADTAQNVAADLDALNDDFDIQAITLTDPVSVTLNLTAAQASRGRFALSDITNAGFGITISDTAANVAANLDVLGRLRELASITLTDMAPSLTVSIAQALNDSSVFQKITNSDFSLAIADTAANVSAFFDTLNVSSKISAITLTDAGTPTLTLSATQAGQDAATLDRITDADYAIVRHRHGRECRGQSRCLEWLEQACLDHIDDADAGGLDGAALQ